MKKAIITALFGLFITAFFPVSAWAQELVVGGEAVGIQISTKGVLVAELAQVETEKGSLCPAKEAGIQKGDFIIEIDGEEVNSAAQLSECVAQKGGDGVELKVQRGNESFCREIKPVQSAEKQWMLGMWLRDGLSGVGTITYMDPESKSYGALGHSISDGESGILLPLNDGSISDAEIVSVTKGCAGKPGELNGCADVHKVLGTVEKNTVFGIFGKMKVPVTGKLMDTGEASVGKACIISTVQGRETKEYDVEISRVVRDGEKSHLILRVTDPELLSITGGIVQGMSGSPIIQNGKLVGAVTHVLVNDPTRGYGIFIENMLDAAGERDDRGKCPCLFSCSCAKIRKNRLNLR